jgi:hypothetical protein
MNLKGHPPADSKAMFTDVDPIVKSVHRQYRTILDTLTREENAKQSSSGPSGSEPQNDSNV